MSLTGIPDSSYALIRKHIHRIHLIHQFLPEERVEGAKSCKKPEKEP
jgi:hypothetical protein